MDSRTRSLFARQLAAWGTERIRNGRYPFRLVETAPVVLTARGEVCPDLVFWINRDSCMAGGILLCPEKEAEQGVEQGRLCAQALGLSHFACWAPKEIVIWELRNKAVLRQETIPLEERRGEELERYRQYLATLMDRFKLLSVSGAVPPDQLPPHYIANLCLGTLEGVIPELATEQRSQNPAIDGSGEKEATAKAALTLARLLALLHQDRLPPTVRPEGMERAMLFAIDTLPASLRQSMSELPKESPLPPATAVRFHHLFRRLAQLQEAGNRGRLGQAIRPLLDRLAPSLGAPAPGEFPDPLPDPLLLVNAGTVCHGEGVIMEVAPAAILAFTSMQRHIFNHPPAHLQVRDVMALPANPAPARIQGTLSKVAAHSPTEQKALSACLRQSWPTRRFPLSVSTPVWAFHLLHLLGLLAEGGSAVLRLPGGWLTQPFAAPILALIAEQYTLRKLQRLRTEDLEIELLRTQQPGASTVLDNGRQPRKTPWAQLRRNDGRLLPFALDLPEEAWALIEEGSLVPADPERWPAQAEEEEIFLFSRSTLGRLLWSTGGDKPALPSRRDLRIAFLRQHIPIPCPEIRENLRFAHPEGNPSPPRKLLDEEVRTWLGWSAEPGRGIAREPSLQPTKENAGAEQEKVCLEEQIRREVFIDGLPRFPEQYLYDVFRPELRHYEIPAPVEICGEFLGLFEMTDGTGRSFQVEGEETARALLLASFSGQDSVGLPKDRTLTSRILDRYVADLLNLHRNLERTCRSRAAGMRQGAEMAAGIWEKMGLPDPKMLEGFAAPQSGG